MKVDIARGAEADALLADEAFLAEWSELWEQCPWATAFQTPGFACAWYASYRSRFEPLLLLSRNDEGRLQGLFLLAVSSTGGELVNAGAHQAEYHAWICPPELGDTFISHAIRRIRREIPRSGLKFRYLPRNAPTGWLAEPEAERICLLKPIPRPLMRFGDGSDVEASLKKSSNKSKLRGLKKLGAVEFKRITDPAEFEVIFNELIPCYDIRRLAINGIAPFQDDSLKKPFHLAMMKSAGMLHVTVLKVGDRIASAQINSSGKKEVQLSLIAHNPLFSSYSPGKLHILFLARMLRKEGYEQLDLTPGGDSYKARFANDWDEVHTLYVFPHALARKKSSIQAGIEESARKILKRFEISTADARSFVSGLKQFNPVADPAMLVRRARTWMRLRGRTRIYSCKVARPSGPDVADLIRRNALEDLLAYQPAEALPSRRKFLLTALRRIEEGHHVYTYAEGGRLLHVAWLVERPAEDLVRRVLPGFAFPANSALVLDLYTFPHARGRGLGALSLRTMLHDTARIPGTENTFIAVPARSSRACRVVEKVGFTYAPSCNDKAPSQMGPKYA